MSNDFSVEGWVFSTLPVDNKPFKIVGQSRQVPKLSIRIKAEREASYYLLTMMLPMSLDPLYGMDSILVASERSGAADCSIHGLYFFFACSGV